MKLKNWGLSILCISLLSGCSTSNENIKGFADVKQTTISIEPEELIYLEDMGLPNFTSTGFVYDPINDSWWIGDHGSEPRDPVKLYQISSDMKTLISCVQIEDYHNDDGINLQGITYDSIDDALWCAIGNKIIEVTKEGKIIKDYTNDYFSSYSANGISFDPDDSSLWVLCYQKILLHLDRNGNVVEEFEIDYPDQDMIYVTKDKIYMTIGADYTGEDNFLVTFDKETHDVSFDYRLIDSYAIEGLFIKDGYLYVVNDGLYHKCTIQKTYISKYTFEK